MTEEPSGLFRDSIFLVLLGGRESVSQRERPGGLSQAILLQGRGLWLRQGATAAFTEVLLRSGPWAEAHLYRLLYAHSADTHRIVLCVVL